MQCGSYIFMDADYGRNLDRDGGPTKAFEPSLFVWATVMSRPAEDRAIVDAGFKALAFDSGPPLVCDEPAATYERDSDEHGRLAVAGATNRLRIGDKIRLVPRPLRPDRQPLRLVRLHPQQPRRPTLADHRERGGVLKVASRPSISRGRASRHRRAALADPASREPSLQGMLGRLSADRMDRCDDAAAHRHAQRDSR